MQMLCRSTVLTASPQAAALTHCLLLVTQPFVLPPLLSSSSPLFLLLLLASLLPRNLFTSPQQQSFFEPEKKRIKKRTLNNFSRDSLFWGFLGFFILDVLPFLPQKKGAPTHPQDNPETLFMLIVFFVP